MFDQIEQVKSSFTNGSDIIPSINCIITSPVLVKEPQDFTHLLKDKNLHLQKWAICEKCDKNHKSILLCVLFPISQVPKIHPILKLVLVSSVKTDPKEAFLCYLWVHMCANGTK